MNFKDYFKKLIKYMPQIYNFTIMNTNSDSQSTLSSETSQRNYKVFSNIKENLDFLKSQYNTLICPDVIIREFKKVRNVKRKNRKFR